jgi:hypothetical protein
MGGANSAFAARGAQSRASPAFAFGGGGRGGFGGGRGGFGGGGRGGFGGGGGRGGFGGGGGRGGGGGGRRSDINLKDHISLIGRLDNGLGFYRFTYIGDSTPYVGVMAQEVKSVMPSAVVRGSDGYLRVFYDKLGIDFQSYEQWTAAGSRIPKSLKGAP